MSEIERAESYSPPEGVRAAAKRALKWIEEGKAGSGFTDVGRKRAADLARGAEISVATLGRMKSFFARHEVDKKATGFSSGEEGYPSPGRVAWDAWGGDAGQSWANSIVKDERSQDDEEERAMAGEVKQGDFVSWYSPSGLASGRVEHVMLDGIYGLPDSNFALPASPENPALAIRIYQPAGEGWIETEMSIGKKMSDVTKINPLMSIRSEEPQMTTNNWKITIPVDRAEEQDGGLFLYGQASGPERDSHGTEMDPTAIQDFADQIVSRTNDGDPLPYLDHHMKDGVLRELGEVVDGSVSSDYRLNIKVRLHPDNPAAAYLHSRIKRGKKYGMSIAGDGVQYRMVDDPSSGEKVIRFLKIKLKEISNTTRPSWVPSFGTVLARSIEGEEIGENMAEELVKSDATEVVENVAANESVEPVAAQVTEQTEAPVVEAPVADAAPAAEAAPVVEAAPVEAAAPAEENGEVERARIAKRDAEKLVEAFNALKGQLETLGVFEPDAPQAAAEAPVAKTEDAPADENVDFNGVSVRRDLAEAITAFVTSKVDESTAVLRETVEKQAEYIKKLEELPAGKLPAAVVREKFETGLPDLGSMSNEDKLKYALGNIYK
jgi:hypothetical protein